MYSIRCKMLFRKNFGMHNCSTYFWDKLTSFWENTWRALMGPFGWESSGLIDLACKGQGKGENSIILPKNTTGSLGLMSGRWAEKSFQEKRKDPKVDGRVVLMPKKAFLNGRILNNGIKYSILAQFSLPLSLVVVFLYNPKIPVIKRKKWNSAHPVVKRYTYMSHWRWQIPGNRTSEQEATQCERWITISKTFIHIPLLPALIIDFGFSQRVCISET